MKITLKLLNSFDPCYNPEEIGFTKDLELTPIEFIDQFRDKVKDKEDIIWVLARKQFMTDRNMRLFAVWCAREALKLVSDPDIRSVNACDVAENYANGKATKKDLDAARAVAWDAANDTAGVAAWDAAWDAAKDAARDAARAAALDAARAAAGAAARDAARAAAWDAALAAQINKLKDFLK